MADWYQGLRCGMRAVPPIFRRHSRVLAWTDVYTKVKSPSAVSQSDERCAFLVKVKRTSSATLRTPSFAISRVL